MVAVKNTLKMLKSKKMIFLILGVVLAVVAFQFITFRLDLTSDKRFTVSDQTKKLLERIDEPVHVTIYLDGDLNPGFLRLRKSTKELLEEIAVYSNGSFTVEFVNPSKAESVEEREKQYFDLQTQGMNPTAIYERDKEGKTIQKVVFPWLKISYKNKTAVVNLLKNIRGISGDENLNISIANLEFEITDGLRRVVDTQVKKIAFIEGHGELSEAETYRISKTLSRYFQIDRGVLMDDATVLDDYKAIVIASPQTAFSERDKYILDQYLMHGGRILWLLEGVRMAKNNLSKNGLSPAIALDLNLDDQLFKYGVRLNPVLLQDVQCLSVPVNIAPAGEEPQFEPSPLYFAPLLLTSYLHPITKNISEVKSEFTSTLEVVGQNPYTKSNMLLATSDNTHIIGVPARIDVGEMPNPNDKNYFNLGYLPVALLVEGQFESNFVNRMLPKGLVKANPFVGRSVSTRQIFVSDGDIIRNETNGVASDSTTLPLGFDRYMNQQFGNTEFIQNAILYLTDEEGWLDLRSRTFKLRLLNKQIIAKDRVVLQIINVLIPLLLLLIFAVVYHYIRKKKYTK